MSKKTLPNIGLGTCVIVTNKEEEILLGKRLKGPRIGYYGLPGGKIETGEPAEEAARRELEEETGLAVSEVGIVGVIREFQEGPPELDFIHIVYKVDTYSGTPVTMEPEKCVCWEWFSTQTLPDEVVPGHRHAIKVYQARKDEVKQAFKDVPKNTSEDY